LDGAFAFQAQANGVNFSPLGSSEHHISHSFARIRCVRDLGWNDIISRSYRPARRFPDRRFDRTSKAFEFEFIVDVAGFNRNMLRLVELRVSNILNRYRSLLVDRLVDVITFIFPAPAGEQVSPRSRLSQ
jgi:hypothetical protein